MCGTISKRGSGQGTTCLRPNLSSRQTRSCTRIVSQSSQSRHVEAIELDQHRDIAVGEADSDQEQQAALARLLRDDSPATSPEQTEQRTTENEQRVPDQTQGIQSAQPEHTNIDHFVPAIYYAAQTVPSGARKAFSKVTAEALNRWVAAADVGGAEYKTATRELFMLCSRLLNDRNGSRQRHRKIQSNIKRYRQGVLDESRPVPVAKRRTAEHQIAARVHKQLMKGNISRATRALDAAEVAKTTPEVMEKLAQLHPDAAPPQVDTHETVPVQITRDQLKKVIKRLPKGSAPGPSGWTFEHVQAVAQSTQEGLDAVLAFVNTALRGEAPECEEVRASRLIALFKKSHGTATERGVRPIAIGEV
jgi:hypothetical protein